MITGASFSQIIMKGSRTRSKEKCLSITTIWNRWWTLTRTKKILI